MVTRMPRREMNRERSPAKLDLLTIVELDHPLSFDRSPIAPERLHLIAVDAAGTGDQLARIDHVRHAEWMRVDLQARIHLRQQSSRPGVVEMDVRDIERGEVGDL